jgi:hypothetical protein
MTGRRDKGSERGKGTAEEVDVGLSTEKLNCIRSEQHWGLLDVWVEETRRTHASSCRRSGTSPGHPNALHPIRDELGESMSLLDECRVCEMKKV